MIYIYTCEVDISKRESIIGQMDTAKWERENVVRISSINLIGAIHQRASPSNDEPDHNTPPTVNSAISQAWFKVPVFLWFAISLFMECHSVCVWNDQRSPSKCNHWTNHSNFQRIWKILRCSFFTSNFCLVFEFNFLIIFLLLTILFHIKQN